MPRKVEKHWGLFYLNKIGRTANQISQTVEMPLGTVRNTICRTKQAGSPLPKKHSNAPKKINKRARDHLRIIRKNSFATFDQLRLQLRNAEIIVSRPTLITCVKDLGFGSFIAIKKPKIAKEHMEIRLPWAQDHRDQ